jgi:YD repeat-containing protein
MVLVEVTGQVSTTTYDLGSQVLGETDPLGRMTTYSYDKQGRLTQRKQPDPVAAALALGWFKAAPTGLSSWVQAGFVMTTERDLAARQPTARWLPAHRRSQKNANSLHIRLPDLLRACPNLPFSVILPAVSPRYRSCFLHTESILF